MQQARLTLMAAAVCVALRTSEAILPIASSCCTEVSHHVSRRLLERVNACSIQRADGDCDLAAVMAIRSLLGIPNTIRELYSTLSPPRASHEIGFHMVVVACFFGFYRSTCYGFSVLHVKRRRICISPHNHTLKRWMRASQVKNSKGNPCRKSDRKSHTPRKHGTQSHNAPG